MGAYCLQTFSQAIRDAEGSKLEASIEAACSKRALALGSVGMSGVP